MILAEIDFDLAFGAFLILAGLVPITYGLVTGSMPPFWDKYKNPRDWCTIERDTDAAGYWWNAVPYGAVALYGCYLVATHWYPGLRIR
jgi:hypothetical protein